MYKMKIILCAALVVCLCIMATPLAHAQTVSVLTENMGLSNHVDAHGKAAGFNVALVREIMLRIGEPSDIQAVPWTRGYAKAFEEPNVALFSTARTSERNDLFQWVGPLHLVRNILVARKEHPSDIVTLAEASIVEKIGCVAGDVRGEYLFNQGFRNMHALHGSGANATLLKMLDAKRLDLVVSSPGELMMASKATGVSLDGVKEVLLLKKQYTYLVFSLSTSQDVVARWQATLDDMKADGAYERIMADHSVGQGSHAFDDPTDYSKSVND